MDFFQSQDTAHKKTRTLVVMFIAAVAAIIACVYLAVVVIFNAGTRYAGEEGAGASVSLWNGELFAYTVIGTLVLVTL